VDNRKFCIALLASAAFLGFGATALADVEATAATCNDCHGAAGMGADHGVPNIAGLSEFYHADQLYFYRDGERPCADVTSSSGTTTNMCNVASDLSDEEIDELGAHFADMPFVPAEQEFDEALAAAGKEIHDRDCEQCHTDGGSNVEDDAGILAGQWMAYLEGEFALYRSGEREQTAPMKKKMDALSDDDFKALLHYYASEQ
jgi:cytochrome c553